MLNNELDSNSTKKFSFNEEWLALGLIAIYLIFSIIWHFSTNAPWDDDCVGRYYNTRNAWQYPINFVSLWNRPLFTLLFFIPFQIGRHAILLMALISSVSAYSLYKVAVKLNIEYAFMVIPMMLFQAFFFTISYSALAEPLAAALISIGYLFYINKKFLQFAIIGSLIPLARLELSVLLVFWVYILLVNKKWKYIFILVIPTVLWSLAGTILEGNTFWLYDKTFGKDNSTNRYGHTDFWHYFQRFIYVIGPIVFYFFFIGLFERLYRRKFGLFLIGQFLIGFGLYVLFSWKLNMGQAAGFLRHLITLSPLVSILAVYGYNYWMKAISFSTVNIESGSDIQYNLNDQKSLKSRLQQIQLQGKKDNLKPKEIRHLVNAEKKNYTKQLKQKEQQRQKVEKLILSNKFTKVRILLYSFTMVVLAFLYFSNTLRSHHFITEIKDYTNLTIITGLTVVFVLLLIFYNNRRISKIVEYSIGSVIIISIMGYTLFTETPDIHNSPERQTMDKISNIYLQSDLAAHDCYVNHPYFFWTHNISKEDKKFKIITQKNLKNAPNSSIIIWENHYSNRLAGNVDVSYFYNKPNYIELFKIYSSDRKFVTVVIQKIDKDSSPEDILKIFDKLIALDPEIAGMYYSRGNFKAQKQKHYKESIEDFNIAIGLDSLDPDAYFQRGLSYFNLSDFELAKHDFEKAAKLKHNFYQSIFNAGVCFTNQKDYTKAIDKYSNVIKLKPDYTNAYYNRAVAHLNLKEFELAILDFTKVTQLTPNNPKAYYFMAIAQFQLGKKGDACTNLQKASELGFSNASKLQQLNCK